MTAAFYTHLTALAWVVGVAAGALAIGLVLDYLALKRFKGDKP